MGGIKEGGEERIVGKQSQSYPGEGKDGMSTRTEVHNTTEGDLPQ